MIEFAPALRAKAAELGTPVKIIACGGNRFDMRWNRALIDACAPLIDYISIHNYEDPQGCNLVATRSEDGRIIVIKAVNPIGQPRVVEVELNGDFAAKTASMQSVVPGSLRARNTLAEPTAVRVDIGAVQLNGQSVRFELPAYSTAVVRVN